MKVAGLHAVVLKPASYTRLSALLFAEIVAEAGLPPGVVNIVTGDREALTKTLVQHEDVDAVSVDENFGNEAAFESAG